MLRQTRLFIIIIIIIIIIIFRQNLQLRQESYWYYKIVFSRKPFACISKFLYTAFRNSREDNQNF